MATTLLALPAQMIAAYLGQTGTYFSETKGEFIEVSDMNPTYAGNAAARYISEARRWAAEAGAETVRPQVWMIRQPLFLALVKRANEI